MAHYILEAYYPTETIYGLSGVAKNEKGEIVAEHFSSNLDWLEKDLLSDVNYNEKNDTYTLLNWYKKRF